MDTDSKKYNTRTMKDEDGQYPQWMNQRAITKLKKKSKMQKKRKGRKAGASCFNPKW